MLETPYFFHASTLDINPTFHSFPGYRWNLQARSMNVRMKIPLTLWQWLTLLVTIALGFVHWKRRSPILLETFARGCPFHPDESRINIVVIPLFIRLFDGWGDDIFNQLWRFTMPPDHGRINPNVNLRADKKKRIEVIIQSKMMMVR